MIPLGILASASQPSQPSQPWSWNPSHLEIGANLLSDPNWDAVGANSWFVAEDTLGDKYVSHWQSGGLNGNLYSSVYIPSEGGTDVDVVVTVGGLGGSFEIQGAIVRVSRESIQRGYLAVFTSLTDLRIYRADHSASRTVLSTVSVENTVDQDKWSIRAQAVGDTIRAKAWLAEEAEPDGWMVEATDDTYPTGGAGFAGFNRRDRPRAFWSIESRI